MPRIDLEVICHKLSIKADAKPVKQKPRRMNENQESFNPTGSLISSLVKKKNGKWRVCIDFTNFNEACPKDNYPLPKIDQLVEVTVGYELLNFMDAYSGYNQIKMHPPD